MTVRAQALTVPADGPLPQSIPAADLQTFRLVMGSFVSGVSLVTTLDKEDAPRGLTCSAICSVSIDPPLLLSSISNRSGTLEAVLARGTFAVNMLGAQGQSLSQLFASGATDKFARVTWEQGKVTGMPLLQGTVAYAECELYDAVKAGDHTLLLGRVVAGDTDQQRSPLTYWRGGYVRLLRSGS